MGLYKFLVWVFTLFSKFMGVKITGRENVPQEGAVVVIGNHRWWSDIVLMALAAYPRQVHFMAKSEYGKNPLLDWLMKHLGSFTVERGEADIRAIKTALGYLKKGEVVGIFPEGTRNRTEEQMLPFKEGAFVLAFRGKAKVLPLAISDAESYAKLGKPCSAVQIGEAVDLQTFLNEEKKFDSLAAAESSRKIIGQMLAQDRAQISE